MTPVSRIILVDTSIFVLGSVHCRARSVTFIYRHPVFNLFHTCFSFLYCFIFACVHNGGIRLNLRITSKLVMIKTEKTDHFSHMILTSWNTKPFQDFTTAFKNMILQSAYQNIMVVGLKDRSQTKESQMISFLLST